MLGTIAFVGVCLYAWALGYAHSSRVKCQRLVQEILILKIGETTAEEIRQLSQRYDGRAYERKNHLAHNESGYEIQILSPYLAIGDRGFAVHAPGIQRWFLIVTLEVRQDRLADMRVGLTVIRPDDYHIVARITYGEENRVLDGERPPYEVHPIHLTGVLGNAIGVRMTERATPKERERILDFDWGCLTGFRECKYACDILPTAWADLPSNRRPSYGDGAERDIAAHCGRGKPLPYNR